MKRNILTILFFLSLFFIISAKAQPTLTYKMANPRIYRSTGNGGAQKTMLQYDIFVKASATGTYFYGAQLGFLVGTPANYNTSGGPPTIFCDVTTGILATKGTYIYSAKAWGFPAVGFGMGVAIDGANWTNTPVTTACVPLTTSYQLLCTIGIEIAEGVSSSGMAELTFDLASMPGGTGETQNYMLSTEKIGDPLHDYGDPSRETPEFTNLYLGRIYCNRWGWSEYSISGSNTQPAPIWSNVYSTSVWDTTTFVGSSGAAPQITATNCQANNLRIHAGAALKIIPGGELKVTASTEINQPRGLWIASTSLGTSGIGAFMDNGEGSVTYNTDGYARIDRYVGQNQWHLIGFPLHTVNPQVNFLSTYLKWYNETMSTTTALAGNKWTYLIMESSVADDLRGYSFWSNSATTGDYTIKYAANGANHLVSGILSRGLTHTAFTDASYDGWNLVANMYPCPIDWEASSGWTKTNVDPTIYLWSQTSGSYATYNGSTHAGTLGGVRYIPSMQGFFVHVTAAGTLDMNNNVKIFNSQAFWKDQTTYNELLDLNVDGNGYKDEAKVWFNHSATVNFDPEYDNYKLTGLDEAPQFYSQLADGNNAAINTLPWSGLNTVVPMGFSLKADAPVTITASNMESFKPRTRIYLEDKKEANTQELTVNPVYTFTASPNDDPNRFVLHFYNPSYGIEDKNLAGLQIYSFEEFVYVRNLVKGITKGTIQIFDPIGRKVFQGTLKDVELNKYLPGVNEGYYMVRVVTDDNSYTQKVYLK
jgi:hypothetical protein